VRSTIATVDRAVRHLSVIVYHSLYGRTRRRGTEQNLIVRSGKSEAEVTNDRRLRSTYCTVEANY